MKTKKLWLGLIVALACAAAVFAQPGKYQQPIRNLDQPQTTETEKKLTLIAKSYIEAKNSLLIAGNQPQLDSTLRFEKQIKKVLDEKKVELLNVRESLLNNEISYTRSDTDLIVEKFSVKEAKARIVINEISTFYIKSDGGPDYTQGETQHLLIFNKVNEMWILESDEILNLPQTEGFKEDEFPDSLPETIFSESSFQEEKILLLSENTSESKMTRAASTTLNRNAIVNYARRYYLNYNSAYRSFGNDCTNFASQCLLQGGWSQDLGLYTSSSAWWYHYVVCQWYEVPCQSYTWAGAYNLSQYIGRRATLVRYTSDLQPGDILFADWNDQQGNPRPDGRPDHTMIVTGRSSNGQIFLTYHSNNRLDRPLAEIIAEKPTAKWYGWKLKTNLD